MLGIDHQHGRQWSNQPGADSGVFERQWRGCICGATAGRGLRLGGADAGATRVRELEACEQGIGPTIHGADDRNEPGATNATDRQLRQDGEGEAGKVSTQEIRQSLHGVGCDSIGIRGQGTREPEWASDQANSGTRVRGVRSGRLSAAVADFGGADIPATQFDGLSQTEHDLSTHAPNGDPHRRAAQTAAGQTSWLSSAGYGTSRRPRRGEGDLPHQRGRRSHAMGSDCGDPTNLGILADSGAGSAVDSVSLQDPGLSFRQWQRVHQLHGGQAIREVIHRANQVTGAAFRRQRVGGSQERRGHPQTHRIRSHRYTTRRRGQHISPRTPEPVHQFSSALRRTVGCDGAEWETPSHLPGMGNAVRVTEASARRRELLAGWGHARRIETDSPGEIRYRGGVSDATGKTQITNAHQQTQRLTGPGEIPGAVEMPGYGQQWKTAIAFATGAPRRFPTAAHSPWKTLRVSHISTASTTILSLSENNQKKGRLRRLSGPIAQAHPSMRKCCRGPVRWH